MKLFGMLPTVCSIALPVALSAQDFASVNLVGEFLPAAVQLDALSGPVDTAAPQAVTLFNSNYGAVATGNTLTRMQFAYTMAAAHAGGYGGIARFSSAYVTYSDPADRNVDYLVLGGLATIQRAADFYAEGGNADLYRGKELAHFDGTGPSPSVDATQRQIEVSNASDVSRIGGATSYGLDFNPADQISAIGLVFLNWNNFQSYQRGNSDYPNSHVRATWTDGTDSVVQMAVQYSQQDNESNAYYGFQQPAPGYYLDHLIAYTIGNNARAWIGLDQIGIAIGDSVVIPEPRVWGLLAGGLCLALVLLRRRR